MSQPTHHRRRSMSLTDSNAVSAARNNKSKPNFLSRFITPSPTPPPVLTPSKSTSAVSTSSLHTIASVDAKVKRKPVVVGPSNSTQPYYSNKKTYDSKVNSNSEDIPFDNNRKTNNSHTTSPTNGSFGHLFRKKRSKSIDKGSKENDEEEIESPKTDRDLPFKKFEKYELPPLSYQQSNRDSFSFFNQVMNDQTITLPNNSTYTPQYKIEQTPSKAKSIAPILSTSPTSPTMPGTLVVTPTSEEHPHRSISDKKKTSSLLSSSSRWSNLSARKSTGSYSIYSTFGPESVYGDDESIDDHRSSTGTVYHDSSSRNTDQNLDLAQIVANNMQTRTPARLILHDSDDRHNQKEGIEEERDVSDQDSDDNDDDDDDDDVFVDATDMSLEDLERERIEARLSKRLSGGHFGSAGGLLLSIAAAEKQQKRQSKPPPEDVAKSMMNWKRQSGQGLSIFSAFEQYRLQQEQLGLNQDVPQPQSNTTTHSDAPPDVPEKDVIYQPRYNPRQPPQRTLPAHPDILLSTTEEVEEEEYEETRSIDNESSISKASSDFSDPKDCAARLWNEDESFVQREHIAEWLGQNKPLNIATLQEYMLYFNFSKMRLDTAFRKVCSKLYFRAEAQQIDRILESFAKRYWQCNPGSILGSSDIVYAVVYSLLLLNTDLHVAQGNYTRMTRQEFVKNTMSTVRDQKKIELKTNPKSPSQITTWEAQIESYLKDMYIAVKNNQILQPMSHQQDAQDYLNSEGHLNVSFSNKRISTIGGKRMLDIKRGINTMIHKSGTGRDNLSITEEPLPRKSTSSANWQPYPVSPSSSSATSRDFLAPNDGLLSPSSTYTVDSMNFNNRPPYAKEGIVMRKHLLESKNQKAKHREWRECLLVVSRGEFKMLGLPNEGHAETVPTSRLHMLKSGGASLVNLADSLSKGYQNVMENGSVSPGLLQSHNNKWSAYTQLIGTVELSHTLSNALPPPGYNRSRPHVFALQESNGGVYLFQSSSNEEINEWVSTCNYWAARKSKEPLQGGIGNIEYGWGSCLNDVILDLDAVEKGKKVTGNYLNGPDTVHISTWVPPAPTMISSILDEKTQYENLEKYVNQLNTEINDHREIKKKILVKFHNRSQNQSKVLTNWETKSTYMLHEIIKYQNYCNILEQSIAENEKI